MSREAYRVPSTSGGAYTGSGATGARELGLSEGPSMQYICSDCAVKMSLRKNDPIRCKECGGRVLYKERTKRMVQFEAR
ncbi:metallothionein-I gene transcription activator [Coniochaeta sp. PMI_546]|nr:metallothionein-I gene transcription activator [Coniochaeta sp. PMI_546]